MPTSINVHGSAPKKDVLDYIVQGLQIANSGFGIANDIQKIGLNSKELKLKDQEVLKGDRASRGVLTGADLAKSGYRVIDEPPVSQIVSSAPQADQPNDNSSPIVSGAPGASLLTAVPKRKSTPVTLVDSEGNEKQVNVVDESKYPEQIQHAQDKFSQDVKESKKQLLAAQNARKLLSGGPISQEAVKTQIARLTGEVGNLTEQDVARFGGSSAFESRIEQLFQRASDGTLTINNRKELNSIIDTFYNSAVQQINDVGGAHAAQLSKLTGMTPDEATDKLAVHAFSDILNNKMKKSEKPTPPKSKVSLSDAERAALKAELAK